MRWDVKKMGSLGDQEFVRLGVQELGYQGLTRTAVCVAKAQDTKAASE